MQIHELTRQTPGTSGNLIFDTGSATYRALVSDVAATIIEQYDGSTLAGASQTLQAAINALNAYTSNNPAFNNMHPLFVQNASTNKKVRVTLGGKTRGSVFVFGVTNSAVPQCFMVSWDNSMTTVTVSRIVGSETAFDTTAISDANYTVEFNVPNYFTFMAFPATNSVNTTVALLSRS